MTETNNISLTDEALDDIKEYIKNSVSYAEYRSGETWIKIQIYNIETLADGRVAISIMFDHDVPDEINEIRFYHKNGFLWAAGHESLNKSAFDEGVLYRFTLKIVQTSAKS